MSTTRINQPPKPGVPAPKSESSTPKSKDAAAVSPPPAKADSKASSPATNTVASPSAARTSLFETTARAKVSTGGSTFAAPASRTAGSAGSSFQTLGTSAAAAVRNAALAQAPVTQRTITLVYDAGPHTELTNLQVKGSWDASGNYSAQWNPASIPMKPLGDGKWAATVTVNDDGQAHDWQWGVTADGPTGKNQWAVMGEGNLKLDISQPTTTYAPTTYHEMGSFRSGQDANFKVWVPNAQSVAVKITDPQGNVQRLPMQEDKDGTWSVQAKGQWDNLAGKSYVYEVVDSEGQTSDRPDPYAREMMGEQRGLDRTYLDKTTGQEVNRYAPNAQEYMRFGVDAEEGADRAYLVLKDATTGKPLSKDELLARLSGDSAGALVDKFRAGQANDFFSKNIEADGRIRMANEGGEWSTLINDPSKLSGLTYEFQVYNKDAQGNLQLVGDADKDGKLSDTERLKSNVNDPWSNLLTDNSGVTFRGSVITDPTSFKFQNDDAPRELDHNKWVIYQLHVGSFLGTDGNANPSTLDDLTKKLDYFKQLGVNTLELLPSNEVEGQRNWGYLGVNSLAVESSFGFADKDGKWVSGTEAMKRFIDEAHKKGLNVISDVVYNHVTGDNNGLWDMGGKDNPYFNWSDDPNKQDLRDTPWGTVPAYDHDKVKQLFVDHAVSQIEELHFDGLRFDFTAPIKDQGGQAGWDMLREINRQVHFYNPNAWTVAEQFDYDPSIARPAQPDGTGAGFDAEWYTEFQHRLVNDNSNPGIIQAASRGWQTNMDGFINMLNNPRGIDGWKNALSIISNHDEVGNGQRTMNTAEGNNPTDFPDQWSRSAARFAAGIGMAGPGIPIFFQGDEFGAQNDFRWGNPSTWDNDWKWQSFGKDLNWDKVTFDDSTKATYERLFNLSPQARASDSAYQALTPDNRKVFDTLATLSPADRTEGMLNITQRQSYRFYQDAIALRKSSPAFDASAQVQGIYSNNQDSVMAFTRSSGDDQYVVVASLNHNNLQGYGMNLPPGNWKEVLNSDASAYGGSNFGNYGATLSGGNTKVNIPAAGYVVFKKV